MLLNYISLIHDTMNFYRLPIIFFSPCRSLLGINHLIVFETNRTISLVTIPDTIAFVVFPSLDLLVLHVPLHFALFPFFIPLHDTLFVQKKDSRLGDSNPRPLEWQSSTLTARPCHSPLPQSFTQLLVHHIELNIWLSLSKLTLSLISSSWGDVGPLKLVLPQPATWGKEFTKVWRWIFSETPEFKLV